MPSPEFDERREVAVAALYRAAAIAAAYVGGTREVNEREIRSLLSRAMRRADCPPVGEEWEAAGALLARFGEQNT